MKYLMGFIIGILVSYIGVFNIIDKVSEFVNLLKDKF